MKLIRSPERLKFALVCVLCLHLYCGNRPTFDVADAMWRMLRALELDLAMSKEAVSMPCFNIGMTRIFTSSACGRLPWR